MSVHDFGLLLFRLKCTRRVPGYFTLLGDKAPPAACDSSEVARAENQRCYPHTRNCEHSWRLSSGDRIFRSRMKPLMLYGPHHRGLTAMRTLLNCFRVKPTTTRFPTNSLYAPMDNTPLHPIPSVCHPWGCKAVLLV